MISMPKIKGKEKSMNKKEEISYKYVGYEYKQILVEKERIGLYIDGYENFGWMLDETTSDRKDIGKSVLHLKRDRKIMNKTELTRLQRHFEDCIRQIQQLENQKTQLATAIALGIGIIGTAFMAGSVFAVTHEPPYYILCTILAIPGFAGWIFPYFTYKKIVEQKTIMINPLIEDKQDEMDEICEKGHNLMT